MKIINFLFALFFIFTSCSVSNLVNKSLENNGIYSDEINYEKNLIKDDKLVKLIPLRHLGTPNYYDKLKNALSKYQKSGYVVYYEMLKKEDSIDNYLRKFRKITSLKTNLADKSQTDYKKILFERVRKIDANFEFKKELIPQPNYDNLILDMKNSKNVDITTEQFVTEYERLYGLVVLDSCDYINNWEKTSCLSNQIKGLDKITIDFRNSNVVSETILSSNNNILILYGEAHMKGIEKGLRKKGFKLIK
jgi:hypothetical protein